MVYIYTNLYIEEYCIWATGDLNANFFYFHSNCNIRVCGRGIKREWEDKGTQKEEKNKRKIRGKIKKDFDNINLSCDLIRVCSLNLIISFSIWFYWLSLNINKKTFKS